MIENPCRDCLDRHMNCTKDCQRWAEYVKRRNSIYAGKSTERDNRDYTVETIYRKRYGKWRNR